MICPTKIPLLFILCRAGRAVLRGLDFALFLGFACVHIRDVFKLTGAICVNGWSPEMRIKSPQFIN